MKRRMYDELLQWKQSKKRKPLILEGARQTGKTYLIREFGENEYEDFIEINCDNNPDVRELFADFNIERILGLINALTGKQVKPGSTLLFLDELQELPYGLTSLKYFYEQRPDIHLIAAGSLLGIAMHEGTGFPVGKVNTKKLYPMDFLEFLSAVGKASLADYLCGGRWDEVSAIATTLTDLLRQYYFVGGMPEAVSEYIESGDVFAVRSIQNEILEDYRRDFSKHITGDEIARVNMVWDGILPQLSKENKKFIYGALRKGARAKEFEKAIEWLTNAGLVIKSERINALTSPIEYYKDGGIFKLYMLDVGLLGANANTKPADILSGNTAFVEYKGAFTENYVANQIIASGKRKLYYYVNERGSVENDFVIEADGVHPVEVKSEENLKSKSLKSVLDKDDSLIGWRFSLSGYREQDRMVNIPLYMAGAWLEKYQPSGI